MFNPALFQRSADLRGVYPNDINEELAWFTGRYLARYLREVTGDRSRLLDAVEQAGGQLRAPHAAFSYVVRANEDTIVRIAALPFVRSNPPRGVIQALGLGVLWLVMTVTFEFSFGHWVAGHSWSRLLADYDLAAGRVWILFLLWITLLPWIAWRGHR